jgi:hypothetical protein
MRSGSTTQLLTLAAIIFVQNQNFALAFDETSSDLKVSHNSFDSRRTTSSYTRNWSLGEHAAKMMKAAPIKSNVARKGIFEACPDYNCVPRVHALF